MVGVMDGTDLTRAFDAVERREWTEAYEILAGADADFGLPPDALPTFAQAAYLAGHPDEAVDSWQRIHGERLKSGDLSGAAEAAVRVCDLLIDAGEFTALSGWVRRADSLLAELPESATHGRAAVAKGFAAFIVGDAATALALGRLAFETGTRVDDAASRALGRNIEARAMIVQGYVEEGLGLLDEATIAATSGELDPFSATILHCSAVCAAQAVADLERAANWTTAMERMLRRSSVGSFHGWCRVHSAEIKRLRGQWIEAEAAALQASEEVRAYARVERGWPLCELGLVRLRLDNLDGAEAAFMEALELGWDPQPGLALLRLAQGDPDAAAAEIRSAVEHPSQVPSWERPPNTDQRLAPVHEAQVEIGVAVGDEARVRISAAELQRIAEAAGTKAMRAVAAGARAEIELMDEEVESSIASFQEAVALWTDLLAPYESAKARVRLATALRTAGSREVAAMELSAAGAAFERLGARRDARNAAAAAAQLRVMPEAARMRKVFMFTDIVGSTELARVMGDEAWRHIVYWHDSTIHRIVSAHDGDVVRTMGDGFFVTFDTASEAVACAVEIQRALFAHRNDHGFAPQVRIGVHEAEASAEGSDWSGIGVHAAARIGALADADEIIASRETGEHAGETFALSAPRSVEVKGITEPIEIVEVRWR